MYKRAPLLVPSSADCFLYQIAIKFIIIISNVFWLAGALTKKDKLQQLYYLLFASCRIAADKEKTFLCHRDLFSPEHQPPRTL
jgi:hypothetical protein